MIVKLNSDLVSNPFTVHKNSNLKQTTLWKPRLVNVMFVLNSRVVTPLRSAELTIPRQN